MAGPETRKNVKRIGEDGEETVDARKTILIFSPDLNLCFSLSMLFQDRFHVVTTTNLSAVESLAAGHSPDLMIADAVPSERLIEKLDALQTGSFRLPIILLYVYNARDVALDSAVRSHVDSVFYKPVEISAVSRRIEELLTV